MVSPAAVAAFALAACSGAPDEQEDLETTSSTAGPDVPAVPSAESGEPRASAESGAAEERVSVEESTDSYEFAFAYPGIATEYQSLEQFLRDRRKEARSEMANDAVEWKKEADAEGFPFNPYSHNEEWTVVTETPELVSLSSEFYVYSGGAHGMSGFDSILWDKSHSRLVQPLDVAISHKKLSDALRGPFCDKLDAERAERRGGPVSRGTDAPFSDCIDPVEQTVIYGSSDREAIDRIGILVGPYAAGSYAEGTYEITLPVTRQVMAAIKPEYRDFFATGK